MELTRDTMREALCSVDLQITLEQRRPAHIGLWNVFCPLGSEFPLALGELVVRDKVCLSSASFMVTTFGAGSPLDAMSHLPLQLSLRLRSSAPATSRTCICQRGCSCCRLGSKPTSSAMGAKVGRIGWSWPEKSHLTESAQVPMSGRSARMSADSLCCLSTPEMTAMVQSRIRHGYGRCAHRS